MLVAGCGEDTKEARNDTSASSTDQARTADTVAVPIVGGQGVIHVVHTRPSASQSAGASTVHAGPPHDTAAVHAVTWDVAKVEASLRDAGLAAAEASGVVRQPFMAVPGALLRLVPSAANGASASSRGEVQAFVYGDQVARARDTDRLDPVRVAPPAMMVSWRATPELIVDNNRAVIVLASDASIRERVRRAIMGGR